MNICFSVCMLKKYTCVYMGWCIIGLKRQLQKSGPRNDTVHPHTHCLCIVDLEYSRTFHTMTCVKVQRRMGCCCVVRVCVCVCVSVSVCVCGRCHAVSGMLLFSCGRVCWAACSS